jgi:transposase
LLRRHSELEKLRHAERNRLEALADPAVAKSITRILAALQKELAVLEKQIAAHLKASPILANEIERLCQIEGVGIRTARWLCAELPRHLLNARGAAAWLSVTPKVRQSGTSVYSTARAGADGNIRLRRALFMAALTARRHNPRLKAFADRLAAAGKSKLSVIIAVLHKLLKIAFCMLKNNTSYNPTHYPLSPAQN